jgi:uncharacterized protein
MPDLEAQLTSLEAIQATVGPPSEAVRTKARDRLDEFARRFIALCPFLCIGSAGRDGSVDVSPRGDPPGFVKVLDDRTLVLPDRAGNRGLDTMRNVFETSSVGMILFVPGIGEVLRINGLATSVGPTSPLLEGMDVRGTAPLSGLVITVHEVFFHCARAIIRSQLWKTEAQIERSEFPTLGEIVRVQKHLDEEAARGLDEAIERGYSEDLYRNV